MDAKIVAARQFQLGSAKEVVDYIASWKEQKGRLRIDPHLKVDRAFRNVSTRDCEHVLTPPNGTKSIKITYYISTAQT
jgi:hypothetical protein